AAVLGASVPGLPHLWLWSIVIVGVLTLVYTFEGGIAAVIWTDLIQLVIYITGSLVAAYMLLTLVPGGWPAIVADARAAGKLQAISWSRDVTVPFTFWGGLIGGCFLTMASHGVDQPVTRGSVTGARRLTLSRWLTAAWGVVLIAIAILARGWGSVFTVGLTIASIVYGPMLGAFLLGVLTRSANQTGVMAGIAVALAAMIAVRVFTPLAWTWYVLAGTAICMTVGLAASARSGAAGRRRSGRARRSGVPILSGMARRRSGARHGPRSPGARIRPSGAARGRAASQPARVRARDLHPAAGVPAARWIDLQRPRVHPP